MENQPLFVLRPKLSVAIIPAVLGWLIIAAFVSIYVGEFRMFFLGNFLLSYILPVIVIASIGIFFRYMNLKNRQYLFYPEKAEFSEGFLNIDQSVVGYEKVTDIRLRRSVWDRLFGTGTISLVTAGSVGPRGWFTYAVSGAGGVAIEFVEEPQKYYELIQKLAQKRVASLPKESTRGY